MKTNRLINIITTHLQYYPKIELQDVYKLLYQSIMGPGHILKNEEKAFLLLKDEFENNISVYEELLFTDISLEHELVRVHIPHFKKIGSAEQLYDMMQNTAETLTPEVKMLRAYWDVLGNLLKEKLFENFLLADYNTLTKFLLKNNFPSMSHSDLYKKLYMPSYRIVLKKFANKYNS